MKKLICLVLAVMLAFSAVSALAAEYTDKDTVKKVQQALNDAGYDCGTPDGAAGKKTKAAITSYQTDKGLTVTGVIDDELLVALGLAEAEAAETVNEMPTQEAASIPDSVEVWIKDEQNFILFNSSTGIMTAYIDWIGEPFENEYKKDDEGYHIDGEIIEITQNGEELSAEFIERGTTRTYHRGTAQEYEALMDVFKQNTDVQWIYGTWNLHYSSYGNKGTITINEDGTCFVFDAEYTWEVGVKGWREYYGITLYKDGKEQYSIVGTADSDKVQFFENSNGGLFGDACYLER